MNFYFFDFFFSGLGALGATTAAASGQVLLAAAEEPRACRPAKARAVPAVRPEARW